MDEPKVKEVRKRLKDYLNEVLEARRLAEGLELEQVVKKLDNEVMITNNQVLIGLAKSKFEKAKSLKGSDPAEAKKLAEQARDILLGPQVQKPAKQALLEDISGFLEEPAPAGEEGEQKEEKPGTAGEKEGEDKAVEAKIKERQQEAEKLAKEGRFDEAHKVLGEAESLAATHKEDMKEEVEETAREVKEEKEKSELEDKLTAWLNSDVFIGKSGPEAFKAELAKRIPSLDRTEKGMEEIQHEIESRIHKFAETAKGDDKRFEAVKERIFNRINARADEIDSIYGDLEKKAWMKRHAGPEEMETDDEKMLYRTGQFLNLLGKIKDFVTKLEK